MGSRVATRRIGRLSEIGQAATRHGFGYLFERRRIALRPWRLSDEEAAAGGPSARGERLRDLFDELGPTWVKFGQLLSTRPDVVPPDIVQALRQLQDSVRPFPFEQVERVVEDELGLTVDRAFLDFEVEPMAAASIGQVHRAVLPNGQLVAVKVQRPDAPRQIEADLALMYQAARFVRQRVSALRFTDPVALVDEFAQSIRAELDFGAEARNADHFRRNFAGDAGVEVPRVVWAYSGSRVLTLEFLEGRQLADVDLQAMSIEARRDLIDRIASTWMTMIFRHGLFHADPHPANVFVVDGGRIGLVDFGQVGKLSPDDMSRLTAVFIDASRQNVEALPRRLAELGLEYPREREAEFVHELRQVFDRYYGARLSDLDPMQTLREALGVIYRMNLRLPTRFVMLDKALATLGAVGVEIYPDFNVLEVAQPYARRLLLERYTPGRLAGAGIREARRLAGVATRAPYQVSDVLEEVRDGQVEIGFRHQGLESMVSKADVLANRVVVAIVVAAGIIGSALLGTLVDGGDRALGLPLLSLAGFCLSTLGGIWLVWSVIRSGRI